MAGSDKLTIRDSDGLFDDLNEFQAQQGINERSKAAREAMRIGIREAKRPLLYRLKDRAADMVFYCILGALISVVIGYATTALTPGHGIRIGVIFLAVGLGILGALELGRMLTGQSEVGAMLRGVLG